MIILFVTFGAIGLSGSYSSDTLIWPIVLILWACGSLITFSLSIYGFSNHSKKFKINIGISEIIFIGIIGGIFILASKTNYSKIEFKKLK